MDRPTRISKRRAPPRQQSNPQRIFPELPQRRSSRLQSKQLGIYHEPQGHFKQRLTKPKALEPVGATSYASLSTSDPVEATVPGPSKEQFEGCFRKQSSSAQILPPANARKRRIDATTETVPLPVKRVHLTRTNSQRPRIEDEEAEQVVKPKPLPLKRPYASFLGESVDHNPSSPASKKYRPDAVNAFVTHWVESISGSESYRKPHCRSDSLFTHSDGDPISRRLTKSTPNMANKHDADGYAVPLTPARSVGTFDAASSTGGSSRSGRSLVENPLYRDANLAANNIYLRPLREQLPNHITGLVEHVGRDRDSPGPSLDQVRHDARLNELWMGSAEPRVEKYFQTNIFPDPEPSDSLKRTDRLPIAKHAIPEVGSNLKISGPVPDMLYGYNRTGTFTEGQQTQFNSKGNEMVANSQGLVYPFFVIEFKGDGPSGDGSLWVATNQCLGGSASCINIAERLNRQLREYKSNKIQPIDSAVFSIAMNGTEARLYISWKHDELNYYMRNVESFLLHRPDHYLEFRKYVRNIIDWGKDKRLQKIRDSLDILLEKNRETASQHAKSRPSPSDDSASSRGHKRKDSRRENTSNHSPDAIQDSQSSHYQSYEEDDPNSQLVSETVYYTSFSDQDGYNVPAQQPLSSEYEDIPTKTLQPLTSDDPADTTWGYNLTNSTQILTTDSGYNPDTSYSQNYDPLDAPTYSTPLYSSENVSPLIGLYEGVNNSDTGGHRRTRRSRRRPVTHKS
ncbi:hypothetical protein ACMFMG_009477 [Clarireedia jacksonii]